MVVMFCLYTHNFFEQRKWISLMCLDVNVIAVSVADVIVSFLHPFSALSHSDTYTNTYTKCKVSKEMMTMTTAKIVDTERRSEFGVSAFYLFYLSIAFVF